MQASDEEAVTLAAFVGSELIARGEPGEVAASVRRIQARGAIDARIAVYSERTGAPVDLDLDGDDAEVARLAREQFGLGEDASTDGEQVPQRRGRGRPRLGVVSREVSLLPRHWEWLGKQRGGASAALRRVVEAARKAHADEDRRRAAIEATHRFMWDIAGDAPGFEEASRALFAGDFDAFEARIVEMPIGVQAQLLRLIGPAR